MTSFEEERSDYQILSDAIMRPRSQIRIRIPTVLAICVSDIHYSLRPPPCREDEKDWRKCFRRAFKQIRWLTDEHRCPVLCSGDIFDKPQNTPETINAALDDLPHMFAIPGNHDLPSHRHELSHRSSYGTLVRAGKITQLGPEPIYLGSLALYGHLLGEPVPKRVGRPLPDSLGLKHVLLTHQYVWTGRHRYHGAPKDQKLSKIAKRFRGFDVVQCGDNHLGFCRQLKSGTQFIGPGALLRRLAVEKEYRPRVGMILDDGSVMVKMLDISKDVWTQNEDEPIDPTLGSFIEKLQDLEPSSLSFREAVLRALDEVKAGKRTRAEIEKAMP